MSQTHAHTHTHTNRFNILSALSRETQQQFEILSLLLEGIPNFPSEGSIIESTETNQQ
jgi:hypothetical protein